MAKSTRFKIYSYLAVSVFLCLLLSTRSSFLFPLNNWDDANSYFSMGKAFFNGKMPYRDVFDQKGMYLYFFYGLSYLVSHTTFAGVFLLELILGTLDAIGFFSIIRLYLPEEKNTSAAIFSVFTFAAVVSSRSFWWGGSAEEISLPFYVWGLYLILSYFVNTYEKSTMSFKTVLLGGILAGFIANIKFTGLGFFFAWMMLVFFSYLAHGELFQGIKACFVFLFGMLLPFIPWLVYFGIRGGLYEWYWGYVYVNVFVYTKVESADPGIAGRLIYMCKTLYWLVRDDWQYFVLAAAGIIYGFCRRKQKILSRLVLPVLFAFMFIGFFGGGRDLPYYSLPLSVFAVMGFAFLGRISIRLFPDRSNYRTRGAVRLLWLIICTMGSAIFIDAFSMNTPFRKVSRDEYFMYRFRDEVLETDNPTLLNVGCLDAGLYTLCDIVPSCRWFQTQTLNIDELQNNPYLEQERYVREGLVDYVLVRDHIPASIDDHYECIDKEIYGWDGMEFNYYLYRKTK
ncbi:hypothetical protein [Butyrivibrio sp. JL13D10]|uniref:hypothetical protein n=1 Tax=Butyrivibrio sp. JL13D10 TaxID=3236815 RepID=UPI0038B5B164